ncbi:MAG TPA: type IV pilus biogenesis/stability protein PilW [Burkholderiales bacterium]|nr:type IV pilus biogenesis/stability protein PilW [Burkholderiales bacterium]
MNLRYLALLFLAACAQQPVEPQAAADAPKSEAAGRARIHTELAGSYYERGQYAIALEELKEAIAADPGYGPAYNTSGLVYMELKEDAVAEKNFQQALRLNGNDSEAHNNYGLFLCSRGRADEGVAHFKTALKNPLYNTPQKALANSGVCLRKLNDDKTAEDYFEKALSIDPSSAVALFHLADIHFKRGQLEDARAYLVRQHQVAAPTAESLWLAVRIERKLGDRNAEASYGLQLRKKFPASPEARALIDRRYE